MHAYIHIYIHALHTHTHSTHAERKRETHRHTQPAFSKIPLPPCKLQRQIPTCKIQRYFAYFFPKCLEKYEEKMYKKSLTPTLGTKIELKMEKIKNEYIKAKLKKGEILKNLTQ